MVTDPTPGALLRLVQAGDLPNEHENHWVAKDGSRFGGTGGWGQVGLICAGVRDPRGRGGLEMETGALILGP